MRLYARLTMPNSAGSDGADGADGPHPGAQRLPREGLDCCLWNAVSSSRADRSFFDLARFQSTNATSPTAASTRSTTTTGVIHGGEAERESPDGCWSADFPGTAEAVPVAVVAVDWIRRVLGGVAVGPGVGDSVGAWVAAGGRVAEAAGAVVEQSLAERAFPARSDQAVMQAHLSEAQLAFATAGQCSVSHSS